MSKKEGQQLLRRLRRDGLVVDVRVTGGNHLDLTLCNGTHYTAARTPSDYRACRNIEAQVRRLTRAKA